MKEFIFKCLDNKINFEGNEVIYLDIDKISDYLKGMFSVDVREYLHSWCESRIGDTYVINFTGGDMRWYKNGVYHRDGDKPAIIYPDGTKTWYKNGEVHRDNDLPAIIYPDGTKEWYKDGKFIKDEESNI